MITITGPIMHVIALFLLGFIAIVTLGFAVWICFARVGRADFEHNTKLLKVAFLASIAVTAGLGFFTTLSMMHNAVETQSYIEQIYARCDRPD